MHIRRRRGLGRHRPYHSTNGCRAPAVEHGIRRCTRFRPATLAVWTGWSAHPIPRAALRRTMRATPRTRPCRTTRPLLRSSLPGIGLSAAVVAVSLAIYGATQDGGRGPAPTAVGGASADVTLPRPLAASGPFGPQPVAGVPGGGDDGQAPIGGGVFVPVVFDPPATLPATPPPAGRRAAARAAGTAPIGGPASGGTSAATASTAATSAPRPSGPPPGPRRPPRSSRRSRSARRRSGRTRRSARSTRR